MERPPFIISIAGCILVLLKETLLDFYITMILSFTEIGSTVFHVKSGQTLRHTDRNLAVIGFGYPIV